MSLNAARARQLLAKGDLRVLFVEELGWDRHPTALQITVEGSVRTLPVLAQKRGMVAYQCPTPDGERFGDEIARWISGSRPPDEIIKHLALLPAAAAGWMFFSGRTLLFPEKDTKQSLQTWPEYWKMRMGFDVALVYAIVFAVLGLIAWGMDWKAGKSIPYICLATSLIGAGTCFMAVYRAQQVVNEIIIQKGAEP